MTQDDSSKIKVLRIINRFNLGGPVWNVSYLSKHLPENYHTVLIGGLADAKEGDALFIPLEMQLEPMVLKSMSREVRFFGDVKAFFEIVKIIRNFKPDIVHTHASKAGALGRLAAYFCGTKVIVHTFHGNVFKGYFSPTVTKALVFTERFLARLSNQIIAISEIQKQELTEQFNIAPERKITVIPLGFNLQKFSPDPEKRSQLRLQWEVASDEVAIGIVGRLTSIKNHTLFIDAALLAMSQSEKKFKFFIVGDGELRNDIENYIVSKGGAYAHRFVFTSWVKKMEECYPMLDLVCLCSLNEGTPVSLIEAQASGIPVVTTDVGGVQNVVLNGQTGIIVQNFEAETFANAMLEIVQNEKLHAQMSQKAIKFVMQNFSMEKLIKNTDELYQKMRSSHA
jgi:glycosyltransferase involved in cell wall biosynthesis